MKCTTLFIPISLFFFLIILSLPLKARDKNCDKLKEYLKSKEDFKKFKKEAGFPLWNKAIKYTFNQEELTIIPFIDYENSFINGLLFYIDNGTSMKYRLISRKELKKKYINKIKSKKLLYHHSLIASFLKFDMIMYNFLERALFQEIDLTKGNERNEIKGYKFGDELLQFVYAK